ncbi:MAG: DUF1080 domain-containing protein [Pirellulaceae bacterium]
MDCKVRAAKWTRACALMSCCGLLVICAALLTAGGCAPADNGPMVDDVSPRPAEDATVGDAAGDSGDSDAPASSDGPAQVGGDATGDKPPKTEPLPDPTPHLLGEADLADGWIALFDGVSLYGWSEQKGDANWRVEDGVIVVDEGDEGFLTTNTSFSDYRLKVDFRAAEGTNSGIFLHTPKVPTDPESDCYELNIAPADNPFPTGSLVKRQKVEGDHTSADWQTFEVTVLGNTVIVLLDGQEVMDYTDENPLGRGYIALQHREGKVEFRNIKLKPLELTPMFNGEDLTGWSEHGDSEFTINDDGELHVAGGKGWLESDTALGDFVLQLECKTNAEGLNSGVFFRCIPGEEMNGYESQIHNGFKDRDRSNPVDAGTGAIFRRTTARRVMGDDNVWVYKTIIADGPHIAVWVNGFQVTDWTDERQVDANPRRGLRLEPGTVQIQGHDPTTDVLFRNLRQREQPRRSEP